MENVTHSRQPNMLSKKNCNGNSTNGFPAAKSMYDDVFGGPPKFGAPTLSPRVEDYTEIFGGFHASRASSIPVLDLPLVDEAEVFFDVRSSGFDYGEVFGGFNGPDFAVSYEELVMMEQANGGYDSSDEAWTPADPEYLSEESDHSAKNQCLSNEESHESVNGSMEFNISYHKASQGSNEDVSNGITHVTKLLDVPGYTLVVDKTTSLPKADDKYLPLQASDDGHLNIDFGGEMIGGRRLRKTMSHPANGSTGGLLFGNDVRSHRDYVRYGSLTNEMFVTISDVSLRTQPSHLPPPSRPPPAVDIKRRDSNNSTPNCKSVASEGSAGDSSPPYFDVEVDASSSAAASAAAIKEAMEKAQAKLKSAKELMERKRDGFQTHTKSSSKNDRKDKEGKATKLVDGSGNAKDERVQGSCEIEENGVGFSVLEERQKGTKTTQLIPDSLEGKKHLNLAKKSAEEKHGGELSSQGSDKIDGAGEWKQATQFFELVKTNKSKQVFDFANNENILVPNTNIHDREKREKKVAVEALERQQENDKKAKPIRADHELDDYEKKSKLSKGACEPVKINGKSKAANAEYEQTGLEKKVQPAQEVFRSEEKVKKQTTADGLQKHENKVEIQPTESNFEVKQTVKHKEKRPLPKVANRSMLIEKKFTNEREDLQKRQRGTFKQEENDKKLKVALEQAENERRMKEALEQEEKEKRVKEAREREENEKKQKEAYQKEENEKRLREALEREENDRRLKEAHEKEENERRLKETLEEEENGRRQKEVIEQEENERKQREAREREENEKIRKEALEKEKNERRLKEAVEQEENDKRQREAREREENEKKLKEALEEEEKEKKQKEALEREETEKRLKEAFEKEELEKRIKEAHEREEIGKRLEEACGQAENSKLRDAQEGEEREAGPKRARKPEEVDYTSQDAFKWKETQMKLKAAGESDDYILLNQACKMDDDKNLGETQLVSEHEGKSETLEATEEIAHGKIEKIPTELRNTEMNAAAETVNVHIGGNIKASGMVQANLEHEKNQFLMEDAMELPCADESLKKAGEAGYVIGQQNIEKIKRASRIDSDIGNQGAKVSHEKGEKGQNIQQAQVALNQEDGGENFISNRVVKESVETGQKIEAAQPAMLEVKGSTQRTALHVNASQSTEGKMQNLNETLSSEEKEAERMKTEKELEKERLRKIEEEREREREREKDRMAVDRSALEARERAYAEARERVERAAVERATAEARQRAMTEARERLERACAEAREKSLYDKTSTEARLRAERAAVERATAEARERAFEKAMAERAAFEARERIERSVSDKFSASSRNSGVRSSLSSSDLQDLQSQSVGSFSGSRYPYSSGYNGSYYAERPEGVEGESAQRCKARLERHRRTAERAAKALAEKNMRDLLAQREQAERNRLAETLDADVKRWSSGKEGNLRALLSTLQYILGPDSGWQPIPLTEVITSAAVKKAYRKATLCVHPDKLQQRGASIHQKYICEKVFDLLKEAWNKFNSEER